MPTKALRDERLKVTHEIQIWLMFDNNLRFEFKYCPQALYSDHL